MRLQDQIVKVTQHALDDVCRAAMAVPADKEDWSPGGNSRSTLSQMREIASTPGVMLAVLNGSGNPKHENQKGTKSLDSVEHCVDVARNEFGKICQAIATFPDIRLDDEIRTPFGEDSIMTMADALLLPYWNLVYHLGQINQIQLVLGDLEMH